MKLDIGELERAMSENWFRYASRSHKNNGHPGQLTLEYNAKGRFRVQWDGFTFYEGPEIEKAVCVYNDPVKVDGELLHRASGVCSPAMTARANETLREMQVSIYPQAIKNAFMIACVGTEIDF